MIGCAAPAGPRQESNKRSECAFEDMFQKHDRVRSVGNGRMANRILEVIPAAFRLRSRLLFRASNFGHLVLPAKQPFGSGNLSLSLSLCSGIRVVPTRARALNHSVAVLGVCV